MLDGSFESGTVVSVNSSTDLFAALSAPDEHQALLVRIKDRSERLREVLTNVNDQWVGEDLIYRFWHQSFKVFMLQQATLQMVAEFEALVGPRPLHPWFCRIVERGTGKEFSLDDNDRWLESVEPIVSAFFHARFFLEMLVKYSRELGVAPAILPSGWAAVLELYQIR